MGQSPTNECAFGNTRIPLAGQGSSTRDSRSNQYRLFAFQALKRGAAVINGSTGAVLDRSLHGLRDLVAITLQA
ncbi:MAG: hypothetical protein ABJA98_01140 [Acidobacteriota bacterium]